MKFRFSPDYEIDTEEEPWRTKGFRVGFFATSGQGKSLNAAILAEQWMDQGGTVIIFEPLAEWHTLKQDYPVQVIGGPHAQDLPLVESQPKLYARAVVEQGISMVFYTRDIEDEEDLVKFVRAFIHEVMTLEEIHHRPILIIIEETHEYAPRNTRGHIAPPWVYARMIKILKDCFTQGRKLNITPVALTQRPQEIDFTIRQLINYAWFGGFSEQDAAYIDREILVGYRKEGYEIKKTDLTNVPTGRWTVIAEGSLHKVDIPKEMRKTPHGADTPKLEYIQPVDIDTQEAISNLGEKLSEMLEKAQEETTELEKVKRQLREANKKIEGYEQQTQTAQDLKNLLKKALSEDSGGDVDKEVVAKLEEKHEQQIQLLEQQIQEYKDNWSSPEEVKEITDDLAEYEKQVESMELFREVMAPIIEPLIKKYIPEQKPAKASKSEIKAIVKDVISDLPAKTQKKLPTDETGIPWIDLWLPKLKTPMQKKIIMLLVEKIGTPLTKDQIALATGYSSTSGTFNQTVADLKNKYKLIVQEGEKYSIAEAPA